jgi:hypothetical protein
MQLAEGIQVARRKTQEFCQRDFSMVIAAFCQLAETTQAAGRDNPTCLKSDKIQAASRGNPGCWQKESRLQASVVDPDP